MNQEKFSLECKIMRKNLYWWLPCLFCLFYFKFLVNRNISFYLNKNQDDLIDDIFFKIIPEIELSIFSLLIKLFFWSFLIIFFFIPSIISKLSSNSILGSRIILKTVFILSIEEIFRFITSIITNIPSSKSNCKTNFKQISYTGNNNKIYSLMFQNIRVVIQF